MTETEIFWLTYTIGVLIAIVVAYLIFQFLERGE